MFLNSMQTWSYTNKSIQNNIECSLAVKHCIKRMYQSATQILCACEFAREFLLVFFLIFGVETTKIGVNKQGSQNTVC